MLIWLAAWLHAYFGYTLPTAFTYFSTRMIFASATSLIFTIWLGPLFIRKLYALKIGQTIRDSDECPLLAELHGKKKDTPTMGGVLILSAMVVSLFLWMDLESAFTWILLFVTLALGFLGGIDDYLKLRHKNSRGLSGRNKLLVQVGVSSMIALYLLCPAVTSLGAVKPPTAKMQLEPKKYATFPTDAYVTRLYVPFFKEPILILDGWLKIVSFALIVFVITGASNAVNLTDGLDGLAAGCLVMVSIVLALFAFLSNHIDLARYLHILYIEDSGEIGV
ncbi:MAG: phospho-N-acetylmuramoyl-pentapeptide-transferase, partial [Chlamydiota bacterium]